MTIYAATLQTNRMQLVADLISSKVAAASTGSASAGTLVIGDNTLSGATGVLATITLSTTAATVSGSVLTISGTPLTATASASGTASKAEIRNNAGTVIVGTPTALTVGTSGTQIILSTVALTSGGTFTLSSGTITHG